MLLAQHSVPGPGLWSPSLLALWLVALSAQSGEDRFGDRRIALAHAGSVIPSIGIAGITPVDGTITKARRIAANIAKLPELLRRTILNRVDTVTPLLH